MIFLRGPWLAAIVIAIGVSGAATQSRGQTFTLPLAGYFHPGRAMPVQWNSPNAKADSEINLTADDAVSAHVQTSDASRGVFPWLAIDRNAGNIRSNCRVEFPPLHPLADSDRLVGSTIDNDTLAAELFPGSLIVVMNLQGPAMAWETLDTLLLTPQGYSKIPAPMREELFAAGIELAVIGETMPDGALPWRRAGRLWIASSGLALPAIVDADAYEPTLAWTPGRTTAFRTRIVLLAAIFCLAACGVGLWKSRWMPAAIVALGVVSSLALAWDNRRQSPLAQASGMICIAAKPPLNDIWLYQSSHRDADFRVPAGGLVQPVFGDESQSAFSDLTLECDERGEPVAIRGRLRADWPLALLRREIGQQAEIPTAGRVTSPMRLLARSSIYPGFSIAGQTKADDQTAQWPTVILQPDR